MYDSRWFCCLSVLFLIYSVQTAHSELTAPEILVLSSSDYEELRDEFLHQNQGETHSTIHLEGHSTTVEPPTAWYDIPSEDDVTTTTMPTPPEEERYASDDVTTTTLPTPPEDYPDEEETTTKASVTEEYPDEEEDTVGAEPVGLSAPTIPPETPFESMEHVVIVGRKTTMHNGKVISVEGVTIEPWTIDEPADTREMIPTHPPGTFPGAIESTTADYVAVEHHGTSTVDSDLSETSQLSDAVTSSTHGLFGPFGNLNAVIAAVSVLGSNLTTWSSENSTGELDIADGELNGTSANTSSLEGINSTSSWFFTGNNEDSVLILSDAVGGSGNDSDQVLDDAMGGNETDEMMGTTMRYKVLPPLFPTESGVKRIGTDHNTHAPTGAPDYHSALWFEQAVLAYSIIAFGVTLVGIVICCCMWGACCQRRDKRREYQVNGNNREKDVGSPLLYQI